MIILRVMTILPTVKTSIMSMHCLPILEVVGNVVQEDGEIDTDILLTIKDDIIREKFLKVNLLIAKTESLKDNPTPSFDFTSSGSTTTHTDISLPEYDSFHLDSEPDSGDFTIDVVEDIFDNPTREPRVHVPNVLPTHPTLHLDSDFTLSMIETLLPFSSENEDKVINPGILAVGKEKSPHLLSHRGFKAFQLISKSPMMIFGGDISILDVPFLHFYPP
ncbi:hypothetical protein Tco_0020973 [Tanacetum coccineum]